MQKFSNNIKSLFLYYELSIILTGTKVASLTFKFANAFFLVVALLGLS